MQAARLAWLLTAATQCVFIGWVCAVTFREEVAAAATAPYLCKAGPVEGCKQARGSTAPPPVEESTPCSARSSCHAP